MERLNTAEGEIKNLPYNAAELIALSAKLAPTVRRFSEKKDDIDYILSFGDFFGEASKRATSDQMADLVETYRLIPYDSAEKDWALPALTAACIRVNIPATAGTESGGPEVIEDPAVPAKLTDAPKSLLQAWALYQREIASYKKEFSTREREADISNDGDTLLYGLVEEALVGDAAKAARELPKFHDHSAHCLGIDPIGDAKTFGMLVALLREGRKVEARGAALTAAATEVYLHNEIFEQQLLVLFKALHLDWESALVGKLIDTELESYTDRNFHSLLGREGGDTAASLINQLVAWLRPERRPEYVSLLAAFIDESKEPMNPETKSITLGGSSEDIERPAGSPVSSDIQKESLRLIEEMVSPDCSHTIAFAAVRVFARTRSPTSIPALQRLALHNDSGFRANAATVLAAITPK